MDYIQFTLGLLIALFIYIGITKIFMRIAAYIGEQVGFLNLFIGLFRKIKKLKYIFLILTFINLGINLYLYKIHSTNSVLSFTFWVCLFTHMALSSYYGFKLQNERKKKEL